jgi:hypothetical protein
MRIHRTHTHTHTHTIAILTLRLLLTTRRHVRGGQSVELEKMKILSRQIAPILGPFITSEELASSCSHG